MNKRGVEALPLRYIIIALVAALVIGIALTFISTLKGGIVGTAEKLNETITEKTEMELDETGPILYYAEIHTKNGWENITKNTQLSSPLDVDKGASTPIRVKAKDEGVGINPEYGVWMNICPEGNCSSKDAVFYYYLTYNEDSKMYEGNYNFTNDWYVVYIHAKDLADNSEQEQLVANITAS